MISQDSFRDKGLIKQLTGVINNQTEKLARQLARPVQIMEICGGHTHAIFHSGLDQLLSDNLDFVHGPGCPVCVLPSSAIDRAVYLANQPDVILATFGDVIRVRGSTESLLDARAKGVDLRILYSPYDALKLATDNPQKRVIFFAVGFDTTMPGVALTIKATDEQNIRNLSFLCFHIRLIPTMTKLLEQNTPLIDGFIGPGHVSIVIGENAFVPIAERFKKPLVIAGFEPVDILTALQMTLRQLLDKRCEIENAYSRVVTEYGMTTAQQAIDEVFADSYAQWRGVGEVAESVLTLKPEYADYDASMGVANSSPTTANDVAAQTGFCNEVLLGRKKPDQCPFFTKHCTPEHPAGPLMVSSEGACAAYYKYKQHNLAESDCHG